MDFSIFLDIMSLDFPVELYKSKLGVYLLKFSSVNAINNGSACSVLFLSTTGLFPARRKILEHKTQSSALILFLSLILSGISSIACSVFSSDISLEIKIFFT